MSTDTISNIDKADTKIPNESGIAIAIVGMSLRLPGANSPSELWQLLSEGKSSIRSYSDRWRESLRHSQLSERKPPVPSAGLLDDIRQFDASFFGISPREAEIMDPQQRLLLELSWEALENAGIPANSVAGTRTGVFVGFSNPDYLGLATDSANRDRIDARTQLGGAPSILANRISWALDLVGPSVAVDTACSASLFAVHLAKQSLVVGESELALAAGVNLIVRPEVTLSFARANVLSLSGHSRPFDKRRDGYVRGEGAGIVVLKTLDRALRDGDSILAVIEGSAVTQDGHSEIITSPTVEGQSHMLELAYKNANVAPRTVKYVETHGTGTPIGDPIELQALSQIIGAGRSKDSPCVVGSIKSNIGHLEGAAGIANLIKAVLCLRHNQIVPSAGFEKSDDEIDLEKLGLRIADRVEPLSTDGVPAVVGVSSFGIGGTNVHVVLRGHESRTKSAVAEDDRFYLVPVSARHVDSVRGAASQLASFLTSHETAVCDVAHSLSSHRSVHQYRSFVVADKPSQLISDLRRIADSQSEVSRAKNPCGKLAFVFSGMGPQWPGMGRELLAKEPVFRAAIERFDGIFKALSGWSLLERVFEAPDTDVPSLVDNNDVGHPAHLALQLGVCELLAHWGVRPDAVVGHSAGEVTAACVSGMLSLEDAARVVFHRSRLVQRTAGLGNMLAVGIGRSEANERIKSYPEINIAAINGPKNVTLAGPRDKLESLAVGLSSEGHFARFVPGCFAYHSPTSDSIRDELVSSLESIDVKPAHISVLSSVRGQWATASDFGASYWGQNVRQPVEFEAAFTALQNDGYETVVEIGAHPALLPAMNEMCSDSKETFCIASLRRGNDDQESLLTTIGSLWCRGFPVRLNVMGPENGKFISLPTYFWRHQPYWMEQPSGEFFPLVEHPIRGERVCADRPTWQSRVSAHNPRWAAHHSVKGNVLLPAVSWIEAWLACALDEGKTFPLVLEGAKFLEMCSLSDEPTFLRIRRSGTRWTLESSHTLTPMNWISHGYAQQGGRAVSPASFDLREIRAALVPQDADYKALEILGYDYGPSFQRIDGLWSGPGRALAKLRPIDEEFRDGKYVLHPALFDSALHALLWGSEALDGLHVPVAIDSITAYGSCEPYSDSELWVVAEIRSAQRGEIVADLSIVDAEGIPMLVARGVRTTRLDRNEILRRKVLYREAWTPRERSFSSPRIADRSKQSSTANILSDVAPIGPSQVKMHEALDELAGAYFANALGELGIDNRDDLHPMLEAALKEGRILPKYRQLAYTLVHTAKTSHRPIAQIRQEIVTRYPSAHLERLFVDRFGSKMAGILRGDIDPLELLHSPHLNLGSALYSDSRSCRSGHDCLRQALRNELTTESRRSHRILEIGAGTGSVASWLLPGFSEYLSEYYFTDISPSFLSVAEERFGHFPSFRTALVNIEEDPAQLSIEPGFDIVIAWSVLHATRGLRRSLKSCDHLLRPGGLLLLVEPFRRTDWVDLIFGPIDGWWRFEDFELRPTHPLLSQQEWISLLAAEGFHDPASLSCAKDGIFTLLAARSASRSQTQARISATHASPTHQTSIPKKERWLIVSDSTWGNHLADKLSSPGNHVLVTDQVGADEALKDERLDHVVCALGLMPSEPTARPVDPDELFSIVSVAKAVAGKQRTLSIVTRAANQLPVDSLPANPQQSAIWGVGRVLASEQNGINLSLIDLGAETHSREIEMVGSELLRVSENPEPCVELALRGESRFAPQLQQPTIDELEQAQSHRCDGWEAWVERPGDSNSISFRSTPRQPPGADEIEVEVSSYGLNFHDVLLSLGTLNLESETGSGAGRLGLECAGTVVGVGGSVTTFRLGDRVVGLPPSAFRTRVTADSDLFHIVPPGMSLDEAVTLPLAGSTVVLALEIARLQKGDTVLIHSAAGGVGLIALRLCLHHGARVLATAGTEEKRALLRDLGASVVMDSHTLDFYEQTLAATNHRGVDIVLNSLSGEAFERSLSLLAPGGRFVELGRSEVFADRSIGLKTLARNASFHTVDLQALVASKPKKAGELLKSVFMHVSTGCLAPLPYHRFPIDRLGEALSYMAAGHHMGKIILSVENSTIDIRAPKRDFAPVTPQATYLITGGLGGFGLKLAHWLVRQGARFLVLMGRRGAATAEAQEAVSALRRVGVEVKVCAGDVSLAEDVARVMAEIENHMPALKGVFHAAMVLEDFESTKLPKDSLERVLAPKAGGAWQLHCATTKYDLDLFVLFSSISRLIAIPGQASYVAANSYLVGLTSVRHALGLPATCVEWGIIGDVGYVSRDLELTERLVRWGGEPLKSDEALDVLDHLLTRQIKTAGAALLNWTLIDRLLPSTIHSYRYKQLRDAALREENIAGKNSQYSDQGVAQTETATVLERIEGLVARILRSSRVAVSPDEPLVNLGFDSLMEAELRAAIQKEYKTQLRMVRGSSLRSISELVEKELGIDVTEQSAPESVPDEFMEWIESRETTLRSFRSGDFDAVALTEALNAVVDGLEKHVGSLSPTEHERYREKFYQKLAPFILESKTARHAHDKPLGYAGDYQLMNLMYENCPAGEGDFQRAVDAFMLDRPGAKAVRNRAPYLASVIENALLGNMKIRLANIGCGPAQEIRRLLANAPELFEKLEILLLDQDEEALADCRAALSKSGVEVNVDYLCASVDQLTGSHVEINQRIGQRELIYSSGLFDYFNDQNFDRYLQALYDCVSPGGQLVVGNLCTDHPDRWATEYATNWFVHYRSKDGLADRGKSLNPKPSTLLVDAEPEGINLFLKVTRP